MPPLRSAASTACRTRDRSRATVRPQVRPLGRGDQAFALGAFAGELARPAHCLTLLAGFALGWLLVVALALQLAENALPLQFLLEHLERLIDVVVADEHLHFQRTLSWWQPDRAGFGQARSRSRRRVPSAS